MVRSVSYADPVKIPSEAPYPRHHLRPHQPGTERPVLVSIGHYSYDKIADHRRLSPVKRCLQKLQSVTEKRWSLLLPERLTGRRWR